MSFEKGEEKCIFISGITEYQTERKTSTNVLRYKYQTITNVLRYAWVFDELEKCHFRWNEV